FLNVSGSTIGTVQDGSALGSVSADRKTISKFHYTPSNKLDYIDQYVELSPVTLGTTLNAPITTDFSRVFLNVSGSTIGTVQDGWALTTVSEDRKTISKFHYTPSNKLDYIDQYVELSPVTLGTTLNAPITTDFSRVFLNVNSSIIWTVQNVSTLGCMSTDRKTISNFHYTLNNKLASFN